MLSWQGFLLCICLCVCVRKTKYVQKYWTDQHFLWKPTSDPGRKPIDKLISITMSHMAVWWLASFSDVPVVFLVHLTTGTYLVGGYKWGAAGVPQGLPSTGSSCSCTSMSVVQLWLILNRLVLKWVLHVFIRVQRQVAGDKMIAIFEVYSVPSILQLFILRQPWL